MLRKMLIVAALALAGGVIGPNQVAAAAHARWMGDASCGAWPKNREHTDLPKAAMLNWVLGWLSRAGGEGPDLLADVNQASVSAWIDNYCAANPLDKLTDAALALEGELAKRESSRAARRPRP